MVVGCRVRLSLRSHRRVTATGWEKGCMSMRSEGVILGAGSNPLAVPTAAASGRSHGPTFFHPYRFPSSPESLYMRSRNSRPGAVFEIGIAALSRSSRAFPVSLRQRRALPLVQIGRIEFWILNSASLYSRRRDDSYLNDLFGESVASSPLNPVRWIPADRGVRADNGVNTCTCRDTRALGNSFQKGALERTSATEWGAFILRADNVQHTP